jgi:glycosyltransferase involved in cell wall biosynthesis
MARILQVCNTDFYLAGFLAPLVRALISQGHTVECVCEGNRIAKTAERVGATVLPFTFPRKASPLGFAHGIARMRKLIRAGGYDCVNGHNRNASIVARIASWMEGVPINLYTAHGFYFHDAQSPYKREATIQFEAALARITTFTLSQSEEDAQLMVRRELIAPERIAVIGNGIDTARFRRESDREGWERRLGLRSGRFRVVAVGRIVNGKGFSDLLRAFAKLHEVDPQSELLMVGGNIDQDISSVQNEFLLQARKLGVDAALTVTGMVQEVEKYLSTCDVFVLPSYREGMPRALLEAMSSELPVIATDIRGCREIISNAKSGFLYPPQDVDRLTSLLKYLHRRSALRIALGQEARAVVVRQFEEKQYVVRQVDAIERLLGHQVLRPASHAVSAAGGDAANTQPRAETSL